MMISARVRRFLSTLVLVLVLLATAAPSPAAQAPVLTILHFNDDYQLTAVDGGNAGGLDRLAALVKQYREQEGTRCCCSPGTSSRHPWNRRSSRGRSSSTA